MKAGKQVFITNERGIKLSAKIDFPNHSSQKVALFSHCFTCNKNYKILRNISRVLCENGFIVLRFDYQGLGQSQGRFAETSFTSNISDLNCVYQYLQANYSVPQLLLGHSLGGATLISALPEWSAKCLVTIGTPAELLHLYHLLSPDQKGLEEYGEVKVNVVGRELMMGKAFIEDLKNYDYEEKIKAISIPTMICHSPEDDIVDIHHAGELFKMIKQQCNFISLDGMDHLLSNEKDAEYLGQIINAWAARYCY